MTGYIKNPHTNIFTGQTGCGKTCLVLELIKKGYNKHFYYIALIFPTLQENDTYHAKGRIKNDDNVWLVDPKDNLYQWIQKLSELLRFLKVLVIIDDINANKNLDKRRQPLLESSISGRHWGHYLWLLTQSYSAIPKYLRRQAKTIFVWYPKEKGDLKMIHNKNDVLMDDELVVVRDLFKKSKHACLYICNEFPRGFRLLNYIWGVYFKWAEWTLLMLLSYLKRLKNVWCDWDGWCTHLGTPLCNSLWQICCIVNTSKRYIYFSIMLFFHNTHSFFYCH